MEPVKTYRSHALVEYSVVPALPEHAYVIAANPRPEDVEEVRAASGADVLTAMLKGIRHSEKAFTGMADGVPILVGGVVLDSMVCNIGTPWMIASKELDKHAVAFIRLCREPIMEILGGYDTLINHVDARNKRAIRWLKWIGFKVESEPKEFGLSKLPFHRFEMEACRV